MTTTIRFETVEIEKLKPDPSNARTHSKKQINQIAASIAENGFINPIIVNPDRRVIAGHGRLRAARQCKLDVVPVVVVTGLTDAQEKRLQLADNKIALNAGWDNDLLLNTLTVIEAAGLDVVVAGFSNTELDLLRMPKLQFDEPFDPVPVDAVTKLGDVWLCDDSRVGCGDLLDGTSLPALMGEERADAIIADSPYNTSNATHNGGKGKYRHREFKYAHGEMSVDEFTRFLTGTQAAMASYCRDGAVAYMFMDHHHAGEQIAAGDAVFGRRLNICIWIKTNAGMGSPYRSQHEMIFVYVVGDAPHLDNIKLGKHGRNRTNCWQAPSVNTFGSRQDDLSLHATCKPVGLCADMILDVTARGDIVLDGFLGSGTTLLAALRTGRRAFGLEIDPAYVDVAITRWMDVTGLQAVLESTGETFDAVKRRRDAEHGTTVAQGETIDG
ncbi:Methyltransferase [Sphingomonas antarctica]|uniref:site-specific DNA-methyltransferase n=1 Tax=Sphingomonas antarctica TaxID=2040274 RepID=UPI0039EB451E